MKICSTCSQLKPLEDFAKRQDCRDGHAGQCKKCHTLKIYEWRKANKDKLNAIKRRYYSSENGKKQKKKEEISYVLSGGRSKAEARRAAKGISLARLAARRRWAKANRDYYTADRSFRRSLERNLSEFDRFVLLEAVSLARVRSEIFGFKWHVDHIIPVSRGGSSRAINLQVVPGRWNQSKGTKQTKFFN